MAVSSYILPPKQPSGIFTGLGKPTIKLEFEDNAELLDFQRKMQGGGADAETAEWYDIPSSRETVPAVRGLEGLTQSQLYNYIFTHVEPLTPINIRGLHTRDKKEIFKSEFGEYDENKYYHVLTPIGEVLVNFNGLFNHLVKHATVKEAVNVIKKTLQTPSVIFNSEDLEGNKSIAFIKAFLIDGKPTTAIISSIDRTGHFLKSNLPPHSENYIYNIYKRGGENLLYPSVLDFDRQRENLNAVSPEQFSFEVVEYRLPISFTENNIKGLNAPGDVYIITDTRQKPRKELDKTAAFKKFDIRPFDSAEFSADGSVVWFPVKDLNFDRANFQNREDEYSQDSVDKIIKAVKKGDFNWAVFDAVTIWQNPDDGKFYVLSGHSRSEAFKRLAAQGATAQGKDFTRIPAKIFKGTLDEARQLALNSNTLSTKETNFERANYWREQYEQELERQGGNRKAAENVVIAKIKETEGKNANSVFYISFLNKKGIFYDALRMLQNAPTQDRERLKVVAEWVGHLRKDRPKLTNAHETELFNFLITDGNYGKAVTNYAELLKRIDTAIIKNTDDGKFDPSKALNLKKNIIADTSERAYIEELARLKKVWDDAEATVKNKLAEWRNRQKFDTTITDKEILDKIEKYKQYATLAKADYYAFLQKKNQYINADKNQQSLFGKTANPYLYNNLDILQHNGMRPTYRILKNYDAFFTDAQHTDQLKGHGLEDTFSLIADVVRNHYKECAKIAKWLKAPSKLQTAYNIWHWLHHNVRYEYDRAGREEIRTPLRVWADRRTGVDCDCLAVFVYCCLLCLGYKPQFEVVAFRGKPNYSHIYVNWDGILIDRVWYAFNSPPPFVTKKKNFVVNIVTIGKLF